ncbi:hypothetical protein AX17_003649 [Amanita inopinata Kibby_2008]|nr:hypothetical protein AX17_003649 [Amanita inopinata Kibby_2008]
MGIFNEEDDPLFILPPPDETPEEREIREREEAEAKKISDRIDEDIKLEKVALKKRRIVRVLLLGQAESGKSTTLKNFRMKYASADWKLERAGWRSVIQLNLIRSTLTIVDALQAEMDDETATNNISRVSSVSTDLNRITSVAGNGELPAPIHLSERQRMLTLRLGPLRTVEIELKKRLGAASEEVSVKDDNIDPADLCATPFDRPSRCQEFGVRKWNNVVDVAKYHRSLMSKELAMSELMDEGTEIIASCREDMRLLWNDVVVKDVLRKRKLCLEDSAGFFLEDVDRVATRDYEPTDDDILRARLRTVGVQEYKFRIETNKASDKARDWILYDVGGARTVRHAWLPYFENVNAIIFLAPVSSFDECLQEDHNVNRLEDSFLLWSGICKSRLLAKATFILFLNKCDILRRKIKNGTRVATYLSGFGDRKNDTSTVVKYLKDKFRDNLKKVSPDPARISYYYPTSVVDVKATSTTLVAVRDGIMRENLREAEFV